MKAPFSSGSGTITRGSDTFTRGSITLTFQRRLLSLTFTRMFVIMPAVQLPLLPFTRGSLIFTRGYHIFTIGSIIFFKLVSFLHPRACHLSPAGLSNFSRVSVTLTIESIDVFYLLVLSVFLLHSLTSGTRKSSG